MPADLTRAATVLSEATPLRFAVDGGGGMVVWAGEAPLTSVRLLGEPPTLGVWVAIDPWGDGLTDPTAADDLVRAFAHLAENWAVDRIVIEAADPVVRDAGRRAGLSGPLRSPLAAVSAGVSDPRPGGAQSPLNAVGLATHLHALLPNVEIEPVAAPGVIRRALGAAATGVADMVELDVRPAPKEHRIRVSVPRRADLVIENVALAVDTTVAVRRVFGDAASHVRRLSFDKSTHGFGSGKYAGTADTSFGVIHLNAGSASASGLATMREQREQRRPEGRSQPVFVPSSFSTLEATTAHECWHQIEALFESKRYRDSIEFRRELGQYFGVETLEQVILGYEAGASPAAAEAHRRLRNEVSAYATTNPSEATAEMFKQWWITATNPPPMVVRFSELLDRYFAVRR